MTKEERKLFDEWQEMEHHQGDVFNYDGIIDDAEWKKNRQNCRIMFLLKEAYHKDKMPTPYYELADDLRDYGPWKMWYKVAEWTRGLLLTADGKAAPYTELTKEDCNKYLRKIAVVNIKKSHGKPNSEDDNLMWYAEKDAGLLYKQIEMINPSIIVCGYTFDFLNKIIKESGEEPIDKSGENHCDNWHYKWKDKIVLDYYHPAYQTSNLLLYYGLVGCYKDALENESKGE
jgi:hypothetical protein